MYQQNRINFMMDLIGVDIAKNLPQNMSEQLVVWKQLRTRYLSVKLMLLLRKTWLRNTMWQGIHIYVCSVKVDFRIMLDPEKLEVRFFKKCIHYHVFIVSFVKIGIKYLFSRVCVGPSASRIIGSILVMSFF